MSLFAIDIDLRRVHCWDATNEQVVVVDGGPGDVIDSLRVAAPPATVLIECASPITYGRLYARRQAWLIYNAAAADRLDASLSGMGHRVLVSPSSVWTRSLSEPVRHKLAGADYRARTKDQTHNVRECQTMAWFFRHHPEDWVPWEDFLRRV